MNTIYIITVDTRHGTDCILVKTKPTDMDIGLIENHYLKAYDLHDAYAEYDKSINIEDIPESVTHYIAQEKKTTHHHEQHNSLESH